MTPITEESTLLGQFIPVQYHFNMLLDEARMQGFRAAIERVVKPGARVLELGGGTGVLSFFAARNAARVWCVERNPALVDTARRMLAMNADGHKVEVVHADAFDYLPPEPVDVVICEMLHVGLLREKQIQVIASFKRRYLERFGGPLPVFVPEATLQAVQPVQQDYLYQGYYAATPVFQNPVAQQDRTAALADPVVFQSFTYDDTLPGICEWQGLIEVSEAGIFNALRFITKNVLAVCLDTASTIDWHNQYLVVPIAEPRSVEPGDTIAVSFSYMPGQPLEALQPKVAVLGALQALAATA